MARGKRKESALTPEEKLAQALVPEDEQPYKVPDNWCWTTLEKVATVVTGGTPSKSHPEYYEGTFPFYKPSDLDAGRYVYEASEYLSDEGKSVSRIIPQNSTAVCCIGSIGKCGFITREGTTNQQINSAIPYFNPLYLYYFLNTDQFINELWSKASATTISIVNKSKMEQCYFPLAPIAEQQRIVARIEYLFAKLDEAKEKTQSVLDSFETRKAAILHKAFTGELTAKWRAEHGDGQEEWQRTSIGAIADVKGGKRVPKGMELTTEDTGHPYIKAGNLKQGTVIDDGMMYVPDDVLQYIKNYTVQAGDVYITNVGACIGDCGVIPPKYDGANLTENAVKITNLRCNSDYLALFLASNTVQQSIKSLIASATLGKLSIANIKTIAIDLPSSKEQMEIVSIIKRLFSKEQRAKEAAEAVLEKIDLLKKSILARAFRGELGTNDPAEESAVGLLKTIL